MGVVIIKGMPAFASTFCCLHKSGGLRCIPSCNVHFLWHSLYVAGPNAALVSAQVIYHRATGNWPAEYFVRYPVRQLLDVIKADLAIPIWAFCASPFPAVAGTVNKADEILKLSS